MKIVITIDDDIYDDYLKQGATLPKYGTAIDSLYEALWNGVPLPKHHGRLIDADELEECKEIMTILWGESKYAIRMDDIRNMPTIIEGSDSK